jgi:hypothetical protein
MVLEAERLGCLLLGPAVYNDRSQCFILPVIDLSGVREVPLKSRIVHDLASMKMSVEGWGFLPKSLYPRSQRSAAESEGKRPERRLKWDCSTNPSRCQINSDVWK